MKYRVTELCFLGGSRRRAGEIVEWDGKPARWMVPIEEEKPVFKMNIGTFNKLKAAIQKLDPANPDHWETGLNLPALAPLEEMLALPMGTLTREQVEKAAPGFTRPKVTE